MYCINCKHSIKSRSKTYIGYCRKYGIGHMGDIDGCTHFEEKSKKNNKLKETKVVTEQVVFSNFLKENNIDRHTFQKALNLFHRTSEEFQLTHALLFSEIIKIKNKGE